MQEDCLCLFMKKSIYHFKGLVITEVTKGVSFLNKIPTDIEVFVLSIALTVTAFFVYMQVNGIGIIWYYVVGAVILGFIVSFLSMYGWSKLTELWKRFSHESEVK